jgi:hypothetical protein
VESVEILAVAAEVLAGSIADLDTPPGSTGSGQVHLRKSRAAKKEDLCLLKRERFRDPARCSNAIASKARPVARTVTVH